MALPGGTEAVGSRAGAVLMGLTLSTKATAFLTLGLLAAGPAVLALCPLGALAPPRKALAPWPRGWTLTALMVGSPWYLKSLVFHRQPGLPVRLPPLRRAVLERCTATAAYNAPPTGPAWGTAPRRRSWLPWNLTMHLMPGHPTPARYPQPFNEFASPLFCGPAAAAGESLLPAFGSKPAPPAVKALVVYALGALALWFATTQFVRFLLPLLPLLCLLAAWAVSRAVAARGVSGYALAGFGVCSLLWSLSVAGLLVSVEAPVVLGQVSQDEYRAAQDPGYDALRFVNTQLPSGAKLVLYGHPLGFQSDRPYLWANLYTSYIPTDRFHSAEDLRRWLTGHGVTHLLIDTTYFQPVPDDDKDEQGWVYQLAVAQGPPCTPTVTFSSTPCRHFPCRGVADGDVPVVGQGVGVGRVHGVAVGR